MVNVDKKVVLIFVNYFNKDGWFVNGVGLDIFVGMVYVLLLMVEVGYCI